MKVLVVGSGGREHVLAWKLRQSRDVSEVHCAPGNAGIGRDARCHTVPPGDFEALLALVRAEGIDLVVVGPEDPLAAGIVDFLGEHDIPALGPSRAAARLESSKIFAKEFMSRHGIPTAPFRVLGDAEEALSILDSSSISYPIVVKADGLAAGKGVIIARTRDDAARAVRRIMMEREFGDAGNRILLEDFLEGREASFIVFTDGNTILPAVPAKDHKAVYDNDSGPNTGGMGAYSVEGILDAGLRDAIMGGIIEPAVAGMEEEGCSFSGILYAGLMLTSSGPMVLEFNVRMGDPEAQVVLPLLESDFAALCRMLCERRLKEYEASWIDGAAVCVVLASGGYPGKYETGKRISGLETVEEGGRVTVFHSGTRREGEGIVTSGGRVLGVTALGREMPEAVAGAYEAAQRIRFEGAHFRRDIGAGVS